MIRCILVTGWAALTLMLTGCPGGGGTSAGGGGNGDADAQRRTEIRAKLRKLSQELDSIEREIRQSERDGENP